jgi:pimeloyl-ACP methyl ester carboxylesterase
MADGFAPYPGPVLFLTGEKSDHTIQNEKWEEIKSAFPAYMTDYKLKTIANASHWMFADSQPAVKAAIKEFLE